MTASLGILTKFASHAGKPNNDRRVYRFLLQSVARDLLVIDAKRKGKAYPERTAFCLRNRIDKNLGVVIKHSEAEKRARYGNLQVCGSVWNCPVCTMRISEQRRKELSKAVMQWRSRGGSVGMLTLTLRHWPFDKLSRLLDRTLGSSKRKRQGAYRRFKSGRWWQELKYEYGIKGDIRALEVTHGKNGWHPHLHIVMFFDKDLAPEWVAKLEREIASRWVACLRDEGLDAIEDRGATLSIDHREIVKYVTKWGIEHEVTKWTVKESKRGGRSPMQLLADCGRGDSEAGRLWLEYARCFKGRSQLQYSRGLKTLLGIGEIDDKTVAEDVKSDDLTLIGLSDIEWWLIKKYYARGHILSVADNGSIEAVKTELAILKKMSESEKRKGQKPIRVTVLNVDTYEEKSRLVFPGDSEYEFIKRKTNGKATTLRFAKSDKGSVL